MNNFERIKNMTLNKMAEFLKELLNSVKEQTNEK